MNDGGLQPVLCPHCWQVTGGLVCQHCGRDIEWTSSSPILEALQASAAMADPPWRRSGGVPPDIEEPNPKKSKIHLDRPVVRFGRGLNQEAVLISTDVEKHHALVVRRDGAKHRDEREYWVFDLGSQMGTFVNGRAIAAVKLESRDLLQIGSDAWILNEEDGQFEPVGPIAGVRVVLEGVAVPGRLRSLFRTVRAGEFVAIAGSSGAGKSTLLRALVGDSGAKHLGRLVVDGRDVARGWGWYRSILGYVSQAEAVHRELSPLQALEFSAELRSPAPKDVDDLKALLWSVDLPAGRWESYVEDLSGGEARRVRVATELVAQPRLLILDEPASGLDRSREVSLMRLLRSLARRGCTVILVTHGIGHLNFADRVWILNDKQLCFDGSPEQLRGYAPDGDLCRLDFRALPSLGPADTGNVSSESAEPEALVLGRDEQRLAVPARSWATQARTLFRREARLALNRWRKRLLVPLIVVPAVFGVSIGLAVPSTRLELLSLLCILASIWMSSSLSVMAIVDERNVFNHERLLFLKIPRYVLAKLLFYCLLSAVQTVVFVLVLWAVRRLAYDPGAMLHGMHWVAAVLLLVGWVAVAMGLAISAFAGDSKQFAAAVLPLVMMCQILFGVQIAGRGDASLHDAYGEFTPHACAASPNCAYRPTRWSPDHGWACDACARWLRKPGNAGGVSRDTGQDGEVAVSQENRNRPNRLAALGSYLTIARFGDILLRSFANSEADYEAFRSSGEDAEATAAQPNSRRDVHRQLGYTRWRWEATLALAGMLGIFYVATIGQLSLGS